MPWRVSASGVEGLCIDSVLYQSPSRLPVSEQTATPFATHFGLLVKGKFIQYRATQRLLKGIPAGITVLTRRIAVSQIRLKNPRRADRQKIFINNRLRNKPTALN